MLTREIIPLKQGLDFQLTLPGSKSITNRAFLCAALAHGKSRLCGALESDDTKVMMTALKKAGIKVKRTKKYVEIIGTGGKFKKGKMTFDLHNAGTATRFLTAVMSVREGETIITGNERMRERPIADLVDGLRQMGIGIEYLGKEGCPPIRMINDQFSISNKFSIFNDQFRKQKNYIIRMKGDKSSQYFSALLMLGPLLDKPLTIKVIGDLVSKPYIDITIQVLKVFGIKVRNNNYQSFEVKPQTYKPVGYLIEGDASAASYWTSIAFLHGGKVRFTNLSLNKNCIQGDAEYSNILKVLSKRCQMSDIRCQISDVRCQMSGVRCQVSGVRCQVSIDMNAMPDTAMTLAVTAAFLKGQTRITGLSTLRLKETDRLVALEKELKKIGVKVAAGKDSIVIKSTIRPPISSTTRPSIETYNDHRMAMCFAVVGTKIPGIVIENPDCVDKTYPAFWMDLERMYLSKKIRLGHQNLVLTGMRGSGKSFLGKKIAKMLGRKFVDLDKEIEKSQKMTIPQIVKKHGWPFFRKVEQKICSIYSKTRNLVIACGGGVVLNPENMKNLKKNGVNVFIFADLSALASRLKKESSNRPSLTGRGIAEELSDVWQARRALYLKYADCVWDNTSGGIIKANLKKVFN